MWEWFKRGGSMYRPCYWRRVGIPGSGGDQWFRADVEYVMCFKRPGKLPWTDNTAMGHPCKAPVGGAMSCRNQEGARTGTRLTRSRKARMFSAQTRRNASGKRDCSGIRRPHPELANPGNLIDTGVGGGGNIGSKLAHENEAPFPEKLAEWFILSLCPPGSGITLDCFSGSGTTASMATKHGRNAVTCDLRFSQCELTKRRIAQTQPVLF